MVTLVTMDADAFRLEGIGFSVPARRGAAGDGQVILRDITLGFPRGKVTALLGHNGSGKSTLMKIMARQALPTTGAAFCDGRPLAGYEPRAFARAVAWLPQDPGAATDLTVGEVVASGRYPWHGPLGRFTEKDRAAVAGALALTGMTDFADRSLATLSGGERQRAWLAMLIAQDSRTLLLDEPTAALDIAHQIEVLSLIRCLSHHRGLAVVIVMHDVNMAARFCDLIHALKGGEVIASGPPGEILTPGVLQRIYGVAMDVLPWPGHDLPLAAVR
ncbi:ABC transporter ATP-binding protein [Pseudogemmobacter sonorensis]|uniref:ABC transporter ATP-binding protein n=1 Tax=Pseudogemmobacter sonorensis TaxID=2989681 RepID=UPI00369E3045